ncbi:hypothetical protein MNBD_GAMMA22-2860 [hydrothermal vent metagenome]|uniref:Glycine zipper 2TM domain-containing protein n=1 Tax=hydrothermal vent metagenome TaxID=652676 RepID=A0A3B1B3G9_9ZZZZ
MMTYQQNITIKNTGKLASILLLGLVALLMSQQSFASPSSRYSADYRAKHVTQYNSYNRQHYAKRQNRPHQNRRYGYKKPRHETPVVVQHRPRVKHYSTPYRQNNGHAAILGGVIGAVVASEFSEGDAAATMLGVVSGVALVNALEH